MEPIQFVKQTCEKCGKRDYQFRGRKKIEAKDGKPEAWETSYRCKACGHRWKVRKEP